MNILNYLFYNIFRDFFSFIYSMENSININKNNDILKIDVNSSYFKHRELLNDKEEIVTVYHYGKEFRKFIRKI